MESVIASHLEFLHRQHLEGVPGARGRRSIDIYEMNGWVVNFEK